jgi:hypothetical protein
VHGRALCHTLRALRPLLKPPLEHWPPKVHQLATATPLARVIVPNLLAQPGLLLGSRPSLPTPLLRVFTHSCSFGGGTHLLDQVLLERKVINMWGKFHLWLHSSFKHLVGTIVVNCGRFNKVVAKRSAGSDDIEDWPARSAILLSTAVKAILGRYKDAIHRRLPSELFSRHLVASKNVSECVWQRVLSACNWG